MSCANQLETAHNNKQAYNRSQNRYKSNASDIYTALNEVRRRMINNHYDREIERLTAQSIQEKVVREVEKIDFSVSLDGEKIANAVAKKIAENIGG